MVYLYTLHINEAEYIKELPSFSHLVSKERLERGKKYFNKIDQIRCYYVELLLKYSLWRHYRIKPENVKYRYNEFGKPLLDNQAEIYFNLSHAGDWVMCGVSDQSIGIDVEGGAKAFMTITKRFFTQNEYKYLENIPVCDQIDAFHTIWTLKESYIKCIGKGLYVPLDSFQFIFSDCNIQVFREGRICSEYFCWSKKLEDGYCVSYCTLDQEKKMWQNDLQIISLKELLRWEEQMRE